MDSKNIVSAKKEFLRLVLDNIEVLQWEKGDDCAISANFNIEETRCKLCIVVPPSQKPALFVTIPGNLSENALVCGDWIWSNDYPEVKKIWKAAEKHLDDSKSASFWENMVTSLSKYIAANR